MSSPTNSLLGRIANAVASPFYTRTRNTRTTAPTEANPGANPVLYSMGNGETDSRNKYIQVVITLKITDHPTRLMYLNH